MPKKSRRDQLPRELRRPRVAPAASAAPRWPWILAASVGALVVVGLLVVLARGDGGTAAVASGEVVSFGPYSRDHVETPQTYAQTPPVGGAHSGTVQNCGIYDTPVPDERAVHSMEHGAVWLTYRPDLAAADVERLRGLARGHTHILLSPYPDNPTPIVASAWRTQLRLDTYDEPKLLSFINTYERGRQTPEPGAACQGGIGTPIER